MSDATRAMAEREFRGKLAPLLALADEHPDASEVWVDGERISLSFGVERRVYSFADFPGLTPRAVEAAGANAAVFAGMQFGPQPPARPMLSVKIPPDFRVTYACPPVSDKWHVAIRFLRSRKLTLDHYVRQGVATEAQAAEIRRLLHERRTIIVSGPTGSGKTTLLRAMLAEIAEGERIIVLEDTPELAVPGSNVLHLQTTENEGMDRLLMQTLRMTPDRIVVGELRGPGAREFVQACNTGHDGTLVTIHSNGAEEALRRLHGMFPTREAIPFEWVAAGIDAVVQITGMGPERRIADVWSVPRMWGEGR